MSLKQYISFLHTFLSCLCYNKLLTIRITGKTVLVAQTIKTRDG